MNDSDSAYLQYLLDVSESPLNISEHRKYAWDYFQLHSTQRIATFNFFVSIATAISAAAGVALQTNISLNWLPFCLDSCCVLYHLFFGNWTNETECSSNLPRRHSRRSKQNLVHQLRKSVYLGRMSSGYERIARIIPTGSGETTTVTLRVLIFSSSASVR
jgi:hypothetical protein